MDRLLGKTALITGAARGLGAQIATRFAEEGARVIINDLNLEAAQKTADAITGLAIACDVSNSSDVERMFADVKAQIGELDILVNNAGISGIEGDNDSQARLQAAVERASDNEKGEIPNVAPSISEVTDESWAEMLAVHLNGTFYCSRAAAKLMIGDSSSTKKKDAENSPAIINMGSIMGTSGGSGAVAYSAAKAGILGFTRALARDLAPYGVRVNAIAPGYILTDMTRPGEAMFPILRAQTPLGKIGEPDDVAWAAVYLASNEAKFVTGQTFSPNGGWHMSQ